MTLPERSTSRPNPPSNNRRNPLYMVGSQRGAQRQVGKRGIIYANLEPRVAAVDFGNDGGERHIGEIERRGLPRQQPGGAALLCFRLAVSDGFRLEQL